MKYTEIPSNISGIYKINFPNNKIYIGRSQNIKLRIWEHFYKKDGTPCYFALKKYYKSYKDIEIDILEEIIPYDHIRICQAEILWIDKFKSCDRQNGYNITSGGAGGGLGINNPASKINEEDLNNIIQLLKEQKTDSYIASIYNLNSETVRRINNGKTYYNNNIDYPIRKGKGIINYFEKKNSFSKEKLDFALYLLLTTDLPNSKISEKTNVSKSIISKLNTGIHPYCKEVDIIFPIRKTRRTIPLTEKEIILIKQELLNKNLSIEDIANHFNCSRDTITDINTGKRYFEQDQDYPIRKFYPNRGSKKSVSTISGSGE